MAPENELRAQPFLTASAMSVLRTAAAAAAWLGTTASLIGLQGTVVAPAALAQGTPSILEFRWDNDRDYRKLYYFTTNTVRQQRAEYYFLLKPKDRKTAILKLALSFPKDFDTEILAKNVKLCYMAAGSVSKRTRCDKEIPATVEITANGRGIEVFPDTPVPVGKTIGVYMNVFNPNRSGMFQINALAQAPGDIPVTGYLGSWLIQVEASSYY